MKITLVFEVDYDGHKLGRCWRTAVCSSPEAVGRMVELFTKPVEYRGSVREFVRHVHREDQDVIIGYLGPIPTFVFTSEKEVYE